MEGLQKFASLTAQLNFFSYFPFPSYLRKSLKITHLIKVSGQMCAALTLRVLRHDQTVIFGDKGHKRVN